MTGTQNLKMSKTLLGLIVLITLYGCDCTMSASGVVIDLRTKNPIEGAILKRTGESNLTVTSDENGEFEFEEVEGLSECQKMEVNIVAAGYEESNLLITNGTYVEIYLDTL